jgi:hypothetical protein
MLPLKAKDSSIIRNIGGNNHTHYNYCNEQCRLRMEDLRDEVCYLKGLISQLREDRTHIEKEVDKVMQHKAEVLDKIYCYLHQVNKN